MRRVVFTRRKRRALAVSYMLAALCVLGGFWRLSHNRAEDYKRQVINTYRHAFSEAASELAQLDAALQKCVYAGTPPMISGVCTDIYGKASAARYALGELPSASGEFEKTYGFLTRVGDYAYALSKKAGAGEALSDDEYTNLKSLSDTATVLSGNLTRLLAQVEGGEVTLEGLYRTRREASIASESAAENALTGGIKQVEGEFPELPTLIYDGPFSTHIAGLTPKMLEGLPDIQPEEARQIAAAFTGAPYNSLKYEGERGGDLPVHMFTGSLDGGTVSVEVSVAGGKVVTMYNSRLPHSAAISRKDAVSIAERFLQRRGFRDMKATYHMTEGDTVLINFAYTQDGVVCYPDLIGVRVALDKGVVAGVQCQGYVMNHHAREIPKAEISEETARGKVSPRLAVLSHAMAVIPTAGKNESFCHEFKCEAEDGRHLIVYVNALTGAEERILILQETEDGTLVV